MADERQFHVLFASLREKVEGSGRSVSTLGPLSWSIGSNRPSAFIESFSTRCPAERLIPLSGQRSLRRRRIRCNNVSRPNDFARNSRNVFSFFRTNESSADTNEFSKKSTCLCFSIVFLFFIFLFVFSNNNKRIIRMRFVCHETRRHNSPFDTTRFRSISFE